MIGVQKRKSAASVTSEMTALASGQMSEINIQHHQQQQPSASKSSRKRTKLTNRSHSASLASQQQQQQQQPQNSTLVTAATSKSSGKHQNGQVITNGSQNNSNNNSNQTDESVWIFGLINNIEQLLSTFTAINTNSTKSCNNSGTSTPTSLSSSFSFSSSNSSSSSLTPSRSTSASSSATSSPASASSLAGSPSSSSVTAAVATSYSPQQQAATTHTTLSTLPRSPISRQIKFHEYKGPPSAKRQQQTAKPPPPPPPPAQQQTSSAVEAQQQLETKSPPMAAGACYNRVPSIATANQEQSNNNHNNNRPIVSEKQQAHEPSSPAPQTALGAYAQTTALATQQQQLKSHHNLCRRGFVQALEERQQIELLGYQQHEALVAHPSPVPNRQPQRHSLPQSNQAQRRRQVASAQDQLTSRQQCAHLQTFYINQAPSTLENLAHGSTLVLAPFIETNTRQTPTTVVNAMQLDHLSPPRQQQQHQQLQHHHQQQPIQQLIQVQSAGEQQQPQPPSSSSIASCGSLGATFGPSASFLESGHTQTLPPAANGEEHLSDPRQYQSTSSGIKLENLAADFVGGQQQSLQDFSNYLQPFNHNHQLQIQPQSLQQQPSQQHHDFCSPQEFTSLSDDLATFGPDSEDTDACEIEPSISFSHGAEELLFSEFIDLQDVPMNVDESDWLKKFLPPCSMG